MADDDFNFDDDDDNIDLGLGDLDFGLDDDDSRPPPGAYKEFKTGIINTLFNTTEAEQLGRALIRRSLPKGYVAAYDFIDKVLGAASDIKDKVLSDNADDLIEIADTFSEKIESSPLPDFLKGYMKDKETELRRMSETTVNRNGNLDDRGNEEELKQFLEENALDEAQRFNVQRRLDNRRFAVERADRIIQSRATNERLDVIADGVNATARGIQLQGVFDRKVSRGFYQRSLEIQYRSFQALRDIRKLANMSYVANNEAFKRLTYNSSLPDIVKSRTHQRLLDKQAGKKRGTLGNFNAGYWDKLTGNIRDNINEQSSNIFQAIAALTGDDLIAKQFFSSPSKALGSAVGMGGSWFLNELVAPVIGDRIRRKATQLADRFGGHNYSIQHHLADIPGALRRFTSRQDGSNPITSLLRGFLDNVLPSYQTDLTLENTGWRNLDKPAQFTQSVQRSIVDVIPGLLSRIWSEMRIWRTGKDTTTRYDPVTGSFIERAKARDGLRDNVVSSSQRESIGYELERFYNDFDQKGTLSDKSRAAMSRILIRQAQENNNFEPDALLSDHLYDGVGDKEKEEIQRHLRDRYDFDDNDKLKSDARNTAKRFSDGRYFRGLKDILPNATDEVRRLTDAGMQDLLVKEGVIYNVDGRDLINNDKLIDWMLRRPDQGKEDYDFRRFGPFFKRGVHTPVMTRIGFERGEYRIQSSKAVLKEIGEITGPVIDSNGVVILTRRDLAQGIRDKTGAVVFRIGGQLTDLVDKARGARPIDMPDDIRNNGSNEPPTSIREDISRHVNNVRNSARDALERTRRSIEPKNDDVWNGGGQYSPSYVAEVVARNTGVNADDLFSIYINDESKLIEDMAKMPEYLKEERERRLGVIGKTEDYIDERIDEYRNGDSISDIIKRERAWAESKARHVHKVGKEKLERLKGMSREELQAKIRERSEALRNRFGDVTDSGIDLVNRGVEAVDGKRAIRNAAKSIAERGRELKDTFVPDFSGLSFEIESYKDIPEQVRKTARDALDAARDHFNSEEATKARQRELERLRNLREQAANKARGVRDGLKERYEESGAKEKVDGWVDSAKEMADRVDERTGLSDKAESIKEWARSVEEEHDVLGSLARLAETITDSERFERVQRRIESIRNRVTPKRLDDLKALIERELGRDTINARVDGLRKRISGVADALQGGNLSSIVRRNGGRLWRRFSSLLSDHDESREEEERPLPPSEELTSSVEEAHEENTRRREESDAEESLEDRRRKFENDLAGRETSPFIPRDDKEARRQIKLGLNRDRRRTPDLSEIPLDGTEFGDDIQDRKAQDVYVGGERKPIIRRREFLNGSLFDRETHAVIRTLDDITGIVCDRWGNIVLDENDLARGLYTQFGDRLYDEERTLEQRFGRNLEESGPVDSVRNSLRSLRNAPHRAFLPGLLHGICDIYVKGESIPRMTAKNIRLRKYIDLNTGKYIDSTKDITGPVVEGNEVILTEEEIKHLVDNRGIKVFTQGFVTKIKRKVASGVKTGARWLFDKHVTFTKWYYSKLFGFSGRAITNAFKGFRSGRLMARLADTLLKGFTGIFQAPRAIAEAMWNGGKRVKRVFDAGRSLMGGRAIPSAIANVRDGVHRVGEGVRSGIGRLRDNAPEKIQAGIDHGKRLLGNIRDRTQEAANKARKLVNSDKARAMATKVKDFAKRTTGRLGEGAAKLSGLAQRVAAPVWDKGKKLFSMLGVKARAILKKDGTSNLSNEQKRDPQLGLLAGINDKMAKLIQRTRRKGSTEDVAKESQERLDRERQARNGAKKSSWLSSIFRRKKKDGDDGDDDDKKGDDKNSNGWGWESEKARKERHAKRDRERRRNAARDRQDRMNGRGRGSRAARRTGRSTWSGTKNLGRMGWNNVKGMAVSGAVTWGLSKVVGEEKANTVGDLINEAMTIDSMTGNKGSQILAQTGGWLARLGIQGGAALLPWLSNPYVLAGAAITAAVAGGGYMIYSAWREHREKQELEFGEFRLAQYGVLGDETLCGQALKLEEACEEARSGKVIDFGKVERLSLGTIFGLDKAPQNVKLSALFWFKNRFQPVYVKHVEAVESIAKGVALDHVGSKLTGEQKANYLKAVMFPLEGETPYQHLLGPDGKRLPTQISTIVSRFEALRDRVARDNLDNKDVKAKVEDLTADGKSAKAGDLNDLANNNLSDTDLFRTLGKLHTPDQVKDINKREGVNSDTTTVKGGFSQSFNRRESTANVTRMIRPIQQIRYRAYGLLSLTKDRVSQLAELEDRLLQYVKLDNRKVTLAYSDDDALKEAMSVFGIAHSSWGSSDEYSLNFWLKGRFMPTFMAWCDKVDSMNTHIPFAQTDVMFDYAQQWEVGKAIMNAEEYHFMWFNTSVWDVGEVPFSKESLDSDVLAQLKDKAQSVLDDLEKAKDEKPIKEEVLKPSRQVNVPLPDKPADTPPPPAPDANTSPSTVSAGGMNASADPTVGQGGSGSMGMLSGGNVSAGSDGVSDARQASTVGPGSDNAGVAMGGGTGGVYDAIPLPAKDGDREAAKPTMEAISKITGVDMNTLMAFAGIESAYKAGVRAKTSSATGWFQMINSTWKTMINKYGKKYGLAPWKGKGTDPRASDPRVNGLMGAEYIKLNYDGLKQRIGRDPNAGDLYMAHFMGLGGAGKILNAPRDGIAAQLFPNEAKANIPLFYTKEGRPRTVQGLIEFMTSRLYGFANKHLGGAGSKPVGAPTMSVPDGPVTEGGNASSDPSVGMRAPTSQDATSSTAVNDVDKSLSGGSPDTNGMLTNTPKPSTPTADPSVDLNNMATTDAQPPSSDTPSTDAPSTDTAQPVGDNTPQRQSTPESMPERINEAPPEPELVAPKAATPQDLEIRRREENASTMESLARTSLEYQKQTAANTSTLVKLLSEGTLFGDPEPTPPEPVRTSKRKEPTPTNQVGMQPGLVNNRVNRSW